MKQESCGYVPELQAGQIKKALCDSDFDGCICGAILRAVYPNIELVFADPTAVQAGEYNAVVDSGCIIADLPYVAGCALYFDHHAGNRPLKPVPGRWAATPSAAGILLEYYRGSGDLERFSQIVEQLDRFDSGSVTLNEIREPNLYFDIGFSVDRRGKSFIKYLAEQLALLTWDKVMQDPLVLSKLKAAQSERKNYLIYLRKHTVIRNNIAYVDMKDYRGQSGHSFFVAMLFLEVDGIVIIKHDKGGVRFNLFRNAFKQQSGLGIDFLRIARQINPHSSGGHKSSCGFTLPEGWTVPQAISEVEQALLSQQDSP